MNNFRFGGRFSEYFPSPDPPSFPDDTERAENTERRRVQSSQKTSENSGKRESKDSDDAEEPPPLAARITTLQEAVDAAIETGLKDDFLFRFARALKAFEITTRTSLTPNELGNAFSLLWAPVKDRLPEGADFDEYRFQFEEAFELAESPLGANHLEQAIRRAERYPPPPEAERYRSPKIAHLVAVCYQLQKLVGSRPFFLSVRDAAKILRMDNLRSAGRTLKGLIRDGILTVVEEGKPGGKRATRYRFNHQEAP